MITHPDKSNLKGKEAWLGSQFQRDTVYHNREGKGMGWHGGRICGLAMHIVSYSRSRHGSGVDCKTSRSLPQGSLLSVRLHLYLFHKHPKWHHQKRTKFSSTRAHSDVLHANCSKVLAILKADYRNLGDCLNLISSEWDKILWPKAIFGRKYLFALLVVCVIEGKPETTEEHCFGSLPLACSVSFLKQPRLTCLGMVSPTEDWAFLQQVVSKKMPYRYANPMEAVPQLRSPLPRCVKLTSDMREETDAS